jgi:hypothetical protein
MDYVEQQHLSFYFPGARHMSHRLALVNEWAVPAYNYSFRGNSRGFLFREVLTELRWAPGEKVVKFGNVASILQQGSYTAPTLELRAVKSLNPEYDYIKAEGTFSYNLNLRQAGNIIWQTTAGNYFGSIIPYYKLYAFRGNGNAWSFSGSSVGNYFAQPHTFNTQDLNEFTATRYATLSAQWNIPNNRFPSKNWNPDFQLWTMSGWGQLLIPVTDHVTDFPLRAPTKGYFETGLAINNLFPRSWYKYLSSIRFVGVGVFSRFQPDEAWSPGRSLSIKLTLGLGILQ